MVYIHPLIKTGIKRKIAADHFKKITQFFENKKRKEIIRQRKIIDKTEEIKTDLIESIEEKNVIETIIEEKNIIETMIEEKNVIETIIEEKNVIETMIEEKEEKNIIETMIEEKEEKNIIETMIEENNVEEIIETNRIPSTIDTYTESSQIITLVTSWYVLSSKYNLSIYRKWINNFLSTVTQNIVIFTNKKSLHYIFDYYSKSNIKIILKEFEEFSTYSHKDSWLSNHLNNTHLNCVSWEVNMLWSEKINFVKEVHQKNYFTKSAFYAWVDIGYFRNRPQDLYMTKKWPNEEKISLLSPHKIYYGQPCSVESYHKFLIDFRGRSVTGLSAKDLPPFADILAGGFCLLHNSLINKWHDLYYSRLSSYFKEKRLVKDDQTIIMDILLENTNLFTLVKDKEEEGHKFDSWFVFQRLLA